MMRKMAKTSLPDALLIAREFQRRVGCHSLVIRSTAAFSALLSELTTNQE
jgi:hypothetical protein